MKVWNRYSILGILFFIWFVAPFGQVQAASFAQPGDSGGDVWDLQYRLYSIGDFNANFTGYYGPFTKNAVTKFQQDYGLQVDGIAGSQTWAVLQRVSVDQQETNNLSHLVYAEAQGEPYAGQVGVAAVVMNRVKSNGKGFPSTVNGVIFQPGMFSPVSNGQFWQTPNATAYQAVLDAVRGWDPTNGALFFFNPATSTNSWIWSRTITAVIGHHDFAK